MKVFVIKSFVRKLFGTSLFVTRMPDFSPRIVWEEDAVFEGR
jgi:hypothetical protein